MLVLLLTSLTMVVEVLAGLGFGSMALLADGLHMGSHAVAMAVSVFAYYYARRHAGDQRFTHSYTRISTRLATLSSSE